MGMHMSASGGGTQYVNRGDPANADWTQADLTLDAGYHDLDMSAIVGARTVLVHLRVVIMDGTAGALCVLRTNGMSNAQNAARLNVATANKPDDEDIILTTDSAGLIEYRIDAGMDYVTIVVAGWWE